MTPRWQLRFVHLVNNITVRSGSAREEVVGPQTDPADQLPALSKCVHRRQAGGENVRFPGTQPRLHHPQAPVAPTECHRDLLTIASLYRLSGRKSAAAQKQSLLQAEAASTSNAVRNIPRTIATGAGTMSYPAASAPSQASLCARARVGLQE